jgi:DNA-binding winged helix-turn-helix (wHTH) protein/TolB-like protein/tetratricopeptide (TPR) repeat protein
MHGTDRAYPAVVPIGNFALDLNKQQLLRDGRALDLRPKSFDVLRYLSTNPGRVVSKDEIFRAVWPDVTVTDDSLVQCISEIRHALGEEGQTLVRTVPRRGYLFIAADVSAQPKPTAAPAVQSHSPVSWQMWSQQVWAATTTRALLGFALTAIVCGGLLLFVASWGSHKAGNIRSVAVLPFDQLIDGDAASGRLGPGLTDLVVVRLSKLGTLRVHPASAAGPRSMQDQTALEVGRNLRVDAVLEGRVYKQHDRTRATARLLRVHDGDTAWSERFEETESDTFKSLDHIALQLASSISSKLVGIEKSFATRPNSVFPEASAAYAKGRFLLGRRTGSSVEGAIQSFETAIRIDRNFALAYAGLAEALNLIGAYGRVEPRDSFMRAKEAALKALELQPALPTAHMALAFAKAHADHDWSAARAGYLRAIELATSNATAWQWLALADAANGQHAEAQRNAKAALKADPLSLIAGVDLGRHFYYDGAYQAAVDQLLKTLDLDPGFVRAHHELGRAYAQQGNFDQAISAAKRAVDLSGRSDSSLASLARAQASAGDRTSAQIILTELHDRKRQRYVSSYHFAVVHAGLGEMDAAVANLEKAYHERFNWTVFINVEPDFLNLRADPRFMQLVKKMNLTSIDRRVTSQR